MNILKKWKVGKHEADKAKIVKKYPTKNKTLTPKLLKPHIKYLLTLGDELTEDGGFQAGRFSIPENIKRLIAWPV